MIINTEAEFKSYFEERLSNYVHASNMVVIIVDPYYGGRNEQSELRINYFLDFLGSLIEQPSFIWFYNGTKHYEPMHSEKVLAFDFLTAGLQFHDRFLFLYDKSIKSYVALFHLGGSINSVNINGKKQIPVTRLSTIEPEEMPQIEFLIQGLEEAYTNKTSKTDWGG